MMYKSLYPYLAYQYTYTDILWAYLLCRKRKRKTSQSVAFEINYEYNLEILLNSINNYTYQISPTEVFTINDPKPREIWAAQFKDRIVHHLIYNSIAAYYINHFIKDTFSCIPYRGTLAAINRCYEFIRRSSQNFAKQTYYAKIDIKNFFVSINKLILWNIIYNDLGNDTLTTYLIYQNIFNNPTQNAIIKPNSNFNIIPHHKSLFNAPPHKGLPIGNVTSQFYSNIYLNALDQYCKHILKIKYYIRYVDDIMLFSNNKEQLNEWVTAINAFIKSYRDIELHEDKIFINDIKYGFIFLGYKFKPYRYELGPRSINKAYKILHQYTDICEIGIQEYLETIPTNKIPKNQIESLQSYLGLMTHGKNYNKQVDLCDKLFKTNTVNIFNNNSVIHKK